MLVWFFCKALHLLEHTGNEFKEEEEKYKNNQCLSLHYINILTQAAY